MNCARVVAIMPVFNEVRHLPRVLQSICAQSFERGSLFVVAVDGNSNDGSTELLEAWFRETGMPGCVAVNPARKIPAALNIGLRYAAESDIVVRLDAHTVYGRTYIADAVRFLESLGPDVGCVGCRYVPLEGTTFGERLVAALYTNPMGLGGADFRFGNDVREVDNVYLGTWRAQTLKVAGGFEEGLEANEDAEISARIIDLGYRILRVPLPCRFIINRSWLGTIRQWHRYGYWRAKMLRANPNFLRPRHVIAPACALAGIALLFSPFRLLLAPLFGLYAALVVRHRRRGEAPVVTLVSISFFPLLQFAFSAGLIRGLCSNGVCRERVRPSVPA